MGTLREFQRLLSRLSEGEIRQEIRAVLQDEAPKMRRELSSLISRRTVRRTGSLLRSAMDPGRTKFVDESIMQDLEYYAPYLSGGTRHISPRRFIEDAEKASQERIENELLNRVESRFGPFGEDGRLP